MWLTTEKQPKRNHFHFISNFSIFSYESINFIEGSVISVYWDDYFLIIYRRHLITKSNFPNSSASSAAIPKTSRKSRHLDRSNLRPNNPIRNKRTTSSPVHCPALIVQFTLFPLRRWKIAFAIISRVVSQQRAVTPPVSSCKTLTDSAINPTPSEVTQDAREPNEPARKPCDSNS